MSATQLKIRNLTIGVAKFDSFGPNAVSKGGGKAFDIEVDVKDSFAFELLESVNEISRSQRDVLETIITVSSTILIIAGTSI